MTTSTAGMSFNSPPATARDCGYGEGDAHCGEMMDFYDIAGDSKKQMGLFTSKKPKAKEITLSQTSRNVVNQLENRSRINSHLRSNSKALEN